MACVASAKNMTRYGAEVKVAHREAIRAMRWFRSTHILFLSRVAFSAGPGGHGQGVRVALAVRVRLGADRRHAVVSSELWAQALPDKTKD
jgi:hypothetical protein